MKQLLHCGKVFEEVRIIIWRYHSENLPTFGVQHLPNMETIVSERMFQHSLHELRNTNMFQFISFYVVLVQFLIKIKMLILKHRVNKQQQHFYSFLHLSLTSGLALRWSLWLQVVLILLLERKSAGASLVTVHEIKTPPKIKTTIKTTQIIHKFLEKRERNGNQPRKESEKQIYGLTCDKCRRLCVCWAQSHWASEKMGKKHEKQLWA